MSLQPGQFVEPYRIEAVLSEGGMSDIYLASAQDRRYHKIAVKCSKDGRAEYQDALRREVDNLKLLRHPSVVRIFPLRLSRERVVYHARADRAPAQPWYFAMEHIPGGSLDGHNARINHLPVAWRTELFYQLLVAVHFIHRAGYTHCDLKPENILLREAPRMDRTPQPVLVDFGSASPISRRRNLTHTPQYAPPEVIRAATDPQNTSLRAPEMLPPDKADVWALGAIYYELLTGAPLIPAATYAEAVEVVLNGKWDHISSRRPDIHKSLVHLVDRMLQTNPYDRPEVGEIIVEVEERIASVAPPRIPTLSPLPIGGAGGGV
jgi:serine/threonine protein kinase